jgi:hypothetical protein
VRVDARYQGRGKRWAEEVMGLSVEAVRKPPKPVPEELVEEAGCGENLLLTLSEQTDEQGLRAAAGEL